MPAAVSPEPGRSSSCVRSGTRLPAAGRDCSSEAPLLPGRTCARRRGATAPPIPHGLACFDRAAGSRRSSDLRKLSLPAARAPRRAAATAQARTQSPLTAGVPSPQPGSRAPSSGRAQPAETRAYLERAPAEAPSRTGGKSRSPRPPPPPQVSAARGGPGRPGSAPASPFSSDAFDPRALRRTSAREPPGSARGDPGNGPRFISFHQAALGSLETAEPVIAFFRRPCADWITANQRLVYTW